MDIVNGVNLESSFKVFAKSRARGFALNDLKARHRQRGKIPGPELATANRQYHQWLDLDAALHEIDELTAELNLARQDSAVNSSLARGLRSEVIRLNAKLTEDIPPNFEVVEITVSEYASGLGPSRRNVIKRYRSKA